MTQAPFQAHFLTSLGPKKPGQLILTSIDPNCADRRRKMKKAIVALARRLAVIMHRIWVDGTEFRWTRDVAAA